MINWQEISFFANAIISYGHEMFALYLRQKGKQPFLKTAQEFGVNIHCKGNASLWSIILNFAEFLSSLKSKNITSEV